VVKKVVAAIVEVEILGFECGSVGVSGCCWVLVGSVECW
jgi:hypothetical protein